METNVLDERLKFVTDYESGQWSMTELCERYGGRSRRACSTSPSRATSTPRS
jgi:hypothetical protein